MTKGEKSGMLFQRFAILMPRLIILVLPLSVLWLVMISRPSVIQSGQGTNVALEEVNLESFSEGFERKARLLNQRGRRSDFAFEAMAFQDGSGSISDSSNGRAVLSVDEKAALVWRRIQDFIPRDFTGKEMRDLRSYIGELVGIQDESELTWRCWAPGASREKALLYYEVESLIGLNPRRVGLFANQFLGTGRWGNVASHDGTTFDQGRPAVLTWSIVPDGTMAPGISGQSTAASDLRSFLDGIYGSIPGEPTQNQPWFSVLKSAFDDMGQTCGVKFVFEENDDGIAISTFADGELGTRGDIRLAARALDGVNETLAFAYAPGYGDLVIDSSDSFFNLIGSSSIRMHNVVAHELGHAMGLSHVCPINRTKLMEPLISQDFRGARFDEFQSLQRQYGDPLEHHSDERDNDNPIDATPLTLPLDDTLSYGRLSIDDNSDIDFFRFSLLGGQKISVDVEPASGSYLEGAQVGEDCSEGEGFDPGTIHNLTLDILGANGVEVLASASLGGLGEGESITNFEILEDGNYFLRINGGVANATQIYDLDIFTEDRPPSPEVDMIGSAIVVESGKVKNVRADPDETLKVQIELKNMGNLATEDLQVFLSGPPNLVFFEIEALMPVLAPNETGMVELVFGLRGPCGIEIPLTLTVDDSLMDPVEFELSYVLGEVITVELLNEGFDDSASFPDGWSNSSTGGGTNWVISPSINVSSAPNAMFCQGVGEVGQSTLSSPAVTLGSEGGSLTFHHSYDMEFAWDGCVLEVSRNGGVWFDLLDSEAVVVSGGYNSTMRSSSTSGLANRGAWTGASGDFVITEVELPASWAGDEVQIRWIIASDRSVASGGWYLDEVQLITSTAYCEAHDPEFAINITEEIVEEGAQLEVVVSSVLPLVLAEEVLLSVGGEAILADLDGDLSGTIFAGGSTVPISLFVVDDGLSEGDEILTLSLAGGGGEDSVTLQDLEGFGSWAASYAIPGDAPEVDQDGDGLSALAEYLLDTDPTDLFSVPDLSIQLVDGNVLFPVGNLPSRNDAAIAVEKSTDLVNWTSTSLTQSAEGLEVPFDGGKSFLRMVFSLNE